MTDAELITKLGGPSKVAQLLGFEKWGVQRVYNWIERGIPADVKLGHPEIFIIPFLPAKKSKATA